MFKKTLEKTPKIILASSSKAREKILKKAGFDFQIIPSNIDETPEAQELAKELVIRLAIEKARAVSKKLPPLSQDSREQFFLIIGSDQVADLDGEIIGKPSGYEEGLDFLMRFRGRTINFFNGLCLFHSQTQKFETRLNIIETKFRFYSQSMAENYLKKYQPYECAGSLKVEGPGIRLIESVISQDPNSLEGLCVIDLISLLENQGYPLDSF